MLSLHIQNETSRLKAVVLGTAQSNGPVPNIEDCYDPKSIEHVKAGTYPKAEDMIKEMEAFAAVLLKYDVVVYRPHVLKDVNQIFARDIAFVIEDKFIKSNILPDREDEFEAIDHIYNQVDPQKRIIPPPHVHVEGGAQPGAEEDRRAEDVDEPERFVHVSPGRARLPVVHHRSEP